MYSYAILCTYLYFPNICSTSMSIKTLYSIEEIWCLIEYSVLIDLEGKKDTRKIKINRNSKRKRRKMTKVVKMVKMSTKWRQHKSNEKWKGQKL